MWLDSLLVSGDAGVGLVLTLAWAEEAAKGE